MRASIRREGQQRRMRERAHQKGLSTSYMEDDDEPSISLSAIKKQFKQGVKRGEVYTLRSVVVGIIN